MVESVPFCGVFIETIRGKVLVAVPGLIPQEELCPLETPQSTEPTVFSENTKWFWKHVKYCKVSSDYYFVSNCLFVFVLFFKGVLGNLTYLKSSFASALPVISAAVKWWKRHGCIICSLLGIHISVNSRGSCSTWRFCWHCVFLVLQSLFCSSIQKCSSGPDFSRLVSLSESHWDKVWCLCTSAHVSKGPSLWKNIPWVNNVTEREVSSESLPLKWRQFHPVIGTEWKRF